MKYTTTTQRPERQVKGFNPFASLTINDLKENKSQIIAAIAKHTDKVSLVMTYMVSVVDDYRDIDDLVMESLIALDLYKFTDNSDMYAAASLRQRGSSMR